MDSQAQIPGLPRGVNYEKLPDGSRYQDIHTRLLVFAAYARRTGHLLSNLTFISAIIMLLAFLWLGVIISREIAWGTLFYDPFSPGMGFFTYLNLFAALVVIGALGYLLGCTIAALFNVRALFVKHFNSTMAELYEGELGLIIADECLWTQLQLKLQKGAFGFSSPMYYLGLERHLLLCASHWNSLKQVSAGKKRLSRFTRNRCQQDFTQINNFYKPKWFTIVGMVLLGLLLTVYLILFVSISLVTNGSRYIIIYARLTALLEFYNGEYVRQGH